MIDKKVVLVLSMLFLATVIIGQSKFSNPIVQDILQGNYAPTEYYDAQAPSSKETIKSSLMEKVSPDSMKQYLFEMNVFKTRNSGSDTLGNNGIGAAREYALSRFQEFASRPESTLIPAFFEFNRSICDVSRHKNICAIQPGADINDPSIIIIEAHFDSRCSTPCDIDCDAHGMEDNASGSALVMELARVMSQNIYDHTIVYMLTVGEEQGLVGADAFSSYCIQNSIDVKAVFNNDIVGGIVCGETSSGPSCPGEGDVDSLQVRLFSNGGVSRQLSRWIKEQYKEELENEVKVPMLLSIMSIEDRIGRGGDHIPFREDGFTAMRFTSANEHGDANAADPDYHDRQHTSDDILGEDTDNDGVIDSFFVDFNYLSRNAVINGLSASFAATGPDGVDFEGFISGDSLLIEVIDENDILNYKIYSRSLMQDIDTSYVLMGSKSRKIVKNEGPAFAQFISVASVDEEGIESILSRDNFVLTVLSVDGEVSQLPAPKEKVLTLLQNRPNPFDEATAISYVLHKKENIEKFEVVIRDLDGQMIERIQAPHNLGMNEIIYYHGYNKQGTFVYSVEINGIPVESKTMVFAY